MPHHFRLAAGPMLLCLGILPLEAQAPPPAPCGSVPEAHALDFWLGAWTVTVNGQPAGRNRIEAVLGGCAITESWQPGQPGEGRSLFYYLPVEKEWRQVWVTAGAMQPGGVKEKRQVAAPDNAVRFQGTIAMGGGRSYLDRTTLTPLADGTVRQLIEYSTDGGSTWTAGFDGIYHRDTPAVRAIPLDSLPWRPAGEGVEVAVAEGNPAGGRFTMMLRFHDGGWLAPHWHNVEKALTVVSGTLLLGQGNRLDPAAVRRLGPGSVVVIPAEARHYEGGAGVTVVSLSAVGPFRTTMVTP